MRIQCPECTQKFEVSEEFLGKTVECGACEKRFKVTQETVVTEKKRFYPGEKRNKSLDNFGKATVSMDAPVNFRQAAYDPKVSAEVVGPPKPRRTLAAVAGALLLLMVIVIFLIAGGPEGGLRDMETTNRFIMAGFAALVGGLLMLYGTARNKKTGWLATIILCGIVLALPKLFPGNPMSATVIDDPEKLQDTEVAIEKKQTVMEDYLFEIGYDPIKKHIAGSNPESVVGVYLRNAGEAVRRKIAAYLYNATDKVSRETSYARGTTGLNGLILLVEQEKPIEEIALLCEKFGKIENLSKDYRIIDVTVLHEKVGGLEGNDGLDPENLNFQKKNLQAMKSIDPLVQMNAVKRLANSEPKALRPDITAQMLKMLPVANNELKVELVKALKVWSKPGDGSNELVFKAVQDLHEEGLVEKTGIDFLIEREVDGVAEILMDLWKKDPVSWAETLQGLGEGAEVLLLPILAELNDQQIVVASEILGKVATKASIAHIEEVLAESTSQVAKKSMQAAIDEIKKRS